MFLLGRGIFSLLANILCKATSAVTNISVEANFGKKKLCDEKEVALCNQLRVCQDTGGLEYVHTPMA